MKIYRTTRTNLDGDVIYVRHSLRKNQFAGAKGAWYNKYGNIRLTLESAEVPDELWVLEETAEFR